MKKISFASRLIPVLLLALIGCATSESSLSREIDNRNRSILHSFLAEQTLTDRPPTGEIVFFDFDHTLADTRTRIPVDTPSGQELRDSKCFHVEPGERPHYDALGAEELKATRPVQELLTIARQKQARGALIFVITARGEDHTWQTIPAWMKNHGIPIDGVVAVNSVRTRRELLDRLNLPDGAERLPGDFKKALIISGWISLMQQKGPVQSVSYYEDTDHHLRGAMQLLPAQYPGLNLQIFDIVRTVGGQDHSPDAPAVDESSEVSYSLRLIAEQKMSPMHDQSNAKLRFEFPGDPRNYSSKDCPFD
ncbi:MAG: hypothetical protein KDK25_12570 [Leptospiraceae bacterium]|nr:hypothetical protein [Leptospiraceae bacterium]